MPKYKCCLQDSWLEDDSLKVWLKKDEKDIQSKFCYKAFSIANGGIENLIRSNIRETNR